VEFFEIDHFSSPREFQELRESLNSEVSEGRATRIPVGNPWAPVALEEEWYALDSGEVWRLMPPDFPFKGIFKRINDFH
jgi:hypothetical protein